MKKVILMANKKIGYKIANFLFNHPTTEIVALFLTGIDENEDKKILDIFKKAGVPVFIGERKHDQLDVIEKLPIFDYIVTVFWPYLLKSQIIDLAKASTVNFHPALLPINRGWYPHVFNILNQTKAGVTLHCIDSGADTGPIWAQSEVPIYPSDTSDKLYFRLQSEMVTLFCKSWDKIINNKIKPVPQDHKMANYNSIKDVQAYDQIHLDNKYTGREIINRLRARTFGNNGYAYFVDDSGDKIRVAIALEKK
jgi:methionyl-tRNA formyltransferase